MKKENKKSPLSENIAEEPSTNYATSPNTTQKMPPEGYMTSEEFWKKVEKKTKIFCLENGLL